jgi:hypothetical protein
MSTRPLKTLNHSTFPLAVERQLGLVRGSGPPVYVVSFCRIPCVHTLFANKPNARLYFWKSNKAA